MVWNQTCNISKECLYNFPYNPRFINCSLFFSSVFSIFLSMHPNGFLIFFKFPKSLFNCVWFAEYPLNEFQVHDEFHRQWSHYLKYLCVFQVCCLSLRWTLDYNFYSSEPCESAGSSIQLLNLLPMLSDWQLHLGEKQPLGLAHFLGFPLFPDLVPIISYSLCKMNFPSCS